MYALIAAVYLPGGGIALSGLLRGERRVARFHAIFVPGFLLYATAWSGVWFALPTVAGEWLASLAGTHAFAAFAWARMGRPGGFWKASIPLFVLHSAGYFAGEFVGYSLFRGGWEGIETSTAKTMGKLGWGCLHGLGFGAGIGWLFHGWQPTEGNVPAMDAANQPPGPTTSI
mgnify:CR=1 FL=1